MPIQWNSSYSIGDADIDSDHQELFRLANSLITAKSRKDQTVCAMALYRYTHYHFKREERLMKMLNYPERHDHFGQHEVLIARLNAIAELIAEGTMDADAIKEFMNFWLLTHIKMSDTKLASHIEKQAALVPRSSVPPLNFGV